MKRLQQIFKDTFDQEKAPLYLLEQTMYAEKKFQSRFPRYAVVLIAIVAILAIGTGTVLGYGSLSGYFSRFDGVTEEDLSSERVVPQENLEALEGKIKVSVQAVSGDAETVYFDIVVENIDGNPILLDQENAKGIECAFTDTYVTTQKGNKARLSLVPVENGTDKSKLRFQGEAAVRDLFGGESYQEQTVTLHFAELTQMIYCSGDLKGTMGSLSEILDQGIACRDFIQTGVKFVYAKGGECYNYSLPKGENQIHFSNQYPTAYIDNFGFNPGGEILDGRCRDWFYISNHAGNGRPFHLF